MFSMHHSKYRIAVLPDPSRNRDQSSRPPAFCRNSGPSEILFPAASWALSHSQSLPILRPPSRRYVFHEFSRAPVKEAPFVLQDIPVPEKSNSRHMSLIWEQIIFCIGKPASPWYDTFSCQIKAAIQERRGARNRGSQGQGGKKCRPGERVPHGCPFPTETESCSAGTSFDPPWEGKRNISLS